MADIRLTTNAHGHGELVIDGYDIARAVQSFAFTRDTEGALQLTVDLAAHRTTVDGESVIVGIPEDTRAALLALGWTPPTEPTRGREATP